jgi:hypothetical protein
MERYCSNCGTEVDDSAVFCPTCGQPIDEEGSRSEMPAAPAWPDATPDDVHAEERARDDDGPHVDAEPSEPAVERWSAAEAAPDAPTRIEERPTPQPAEPTEDRRPVEPSDEESWSATPRSAAPPPAVTPERREAPRRQGMDLPLTTPVTLSGWLIGVGSAIAALGLVVILIVGVINAIDLLLLLALVGVAATVFFSAQLPAVPHLRLMTLVVTVLTFGVALDRIGFGGAGVGELLLFMGSAAAAIGAVLLELGQDQPLGRPQR